MILVTLDFYDTQSSDILVAMYGCSQSVWMEGYLFESWFINKFIPMTKTDKPRLFICDGHNSHLTYNVAKAAYDNNIHILCLPPPTLVMLCNP